MTRDDIWRTGNVSSCSKEMPSLTLGSNPVNHYHHHKKKESFFVGIKDLNQQGSKQHGGQLAWGAKLP